MHFMLRQTPQRLPLTTVMELLSATYMPAMLTYNSWKGGGMEYPFTAGTSVVYRPRIWNGVIHYGVRVLLLTNGAAVERMSSTSVAARVVPAQYYVDVVYPGCPPLSDTIVLTPAALPVVALGADAVSLAQMIHLHLLK